MKTQKILLTLLITVLCASVSTAQIADKKVLTLDGAKHVIAAAEAQARQLNAPSAVIAVVDDGGNLMALERLDGTFSAGADVSIGKARTAVRFKKPHSHGGTGRLHPANRRNSDHARRSDYRRRWREWRFVGPAR